jgi:ribonuclease HII
MTKAAASRASSPVVQRCTGSFEREARESGYTRIAGVDEVGRGCLFGPVFAAAVVLDPERPVRGLRDSKQLAPERRQELDQAIRSSAIAWSVAGADAYEIDRFNIRQATRLAMKRAVDGLRPVPDYLLVDALDIDLPIAQRGLIHGDARSQSIAAASILAKVARDRVMERWHEVFPEYGLARHKGYSTADHVAAIRRYGPTTFHRFSFEPVRNHQMELFAGSAGATA